MAFTPWKGFPPTRHYWPVDPAQGCLPGQAGDRCQHGKNVFSEDRARLSLLVSHL